MELTSIANIQRGNQSGADRSKFPKFFKRPWDKSVKKIATKKVKTDDFLGWFEKRFSGSAIE